MDSGGKFAYVPIFPSGIEGYSINSTAGALALIAGSPFPRGGNGAGFAVAFDPRGKFAYVVNLTDSDISAGAIDPTTGALEEVLGSPFPAGAEPDAMCRQLCRVVACHVVSRRGEEYDAHLTRLANGAQSREEAR